jgi:hypothetical protein
MEAAAGNSFAFVGHAAGHRLPLDPECARYCQELIAAKSFHLLPLKFCMQLHFLLRVEPRREPFLPTPGGGLRHPDGPGGGGSIL